MKHDFIDHHREGDSPIHLADPRLKIIMMVTYIFVVVLIPRQAKHFFPVRHPFASRPDQRDICFSFSL